MPQGCWDPAPRVLGAGAGGAVPVGWQGAPKPRKMDWESGGHGACGWQTSLSPRGTAVPTRHRCPGPAWGRAGQPGAALLGPSPLQVLPGTRGHSRDLGTAPPPIPDGGDTRGLQQDGCPRALSPCGAARRGDTCGERGGDGESQTAPQTPGTAGTGRDPADGAVLSPQHTSCASPQQTSCASCAAAKSGSEPTGVKSPPWRRWAARPPPGGAPQQQPPTGSRLSEQFCTFAAHQRPQQLLESQPLSSPSTAPRAPRVCFGSPGSWRHLLSFSSANEPVFLQHLPSKRGPPALSLRCPSW